MGGAGQREAANEEARGIVREEAREIGLEGEEGICHEKRNVYDKE